MEEADKNADLTVHSLYSWARGGNFLTRSITVKRAGNVEGPLSCRQIIGWDPIEERSAFVDLARRRRGRIRRRPLHPRRRPLAAPGNRRGAPDGSRTGSDVTISKLSADRYTWESNNRTPRRGSAAQRQPHRNQPRERKLKVCARDFLQFWPRRWRSRWFLIARLFMGAAVAGEGGVVVVAAVVAVADVVVAEEGVAGPEAAGWW